RTAPPRTRSDGPVRSPPYLALLRAGFCLPPALPPARCALTAPFHPYSPPRLRREGGRYVFCATFRRVAPPGCYPAHCPVELGLSSHLRAFGATVGKLLLIDAKGLVHRSPQGEGGRSSGRLRT